MKCLICGKEYDDGYSACPDCEYPNIQILGSSEKAREKMMQMARQYKEELLEPVWIKLKTYSYDEKEDGNLVLAEEKWIPMGAGKELEKGKIIWHPEEFHLVERDFEIDIAVINTKGEEKRYKLKMKNPKTENGWQIGVCLQEDFKILIVVGNEKVHTKSKIISIL